MEDLDTEFLTDLLFLEPAMSPTIQHSWEIPDIPDSSHSAGLEDRTQNHGGFARVLERESSSEHSIAFTKLPDMSTETLSNESAYHLTTSYDQLRGESQESDFPSKLDHCQRGRRTRSGSLI
jgi:hypothetical protein